MSRDWNAASYDRVSGPQAAWAEAVLERLPLRGDETVLDAGCGSGRVTTMLLERLPDGHVVAVDAAPSMVEHARAALPADRATVLCASLTELVLDEPVDAVFSNAVFHWIHDHGRLFGVLHRALRPGGRVEAQCGGSGNIASFYAALREVAAIEPYARYLGGFEPNRFAGPEETEQLLADAGFEEAECTLVEWPVRPGEPREFVRSVCLGAHSELLPEELRPGMLDEVMDRLGPDPELGYVRLNISARKRATPA
jgi:trans-aconitate 2-methyltransferase